jgi:hypothetical protein
MGNLLLFHAIFFIIAFSGRREQPAKSVMEKRKNALPEKSAL